jgi:hypothetical protein|tara:strand:+ start:1639 stop:2238 length:600 start_codon:yes stop_codon:yes gene_type:complete
VIILEMEQGSDEWLAARLGRPSASMFSKLITTKGKPSTQAGGYINKLAGERLSGESEAFYTNEHMVRGTELEPEAREAYEFISGNDVLEVGFVVDPSFEYGCSPDGLIGTDGGIEIKCPAATTMMKYYQDSEELVKAYYQQIQGCMWVTKRDWWDAFAYHPKMKHVLVRVSRDDAFIAKLAVEVEAAVIEIKNQVEQYK